ncbi:MAG: hypothetical protein IJ920_10265, partial [Paludibacteraceae bacterium]|nr:hypothetical protein [Paludibacteraceae bacterium]
MKKLFLFATTLLCTLSLSAASYGIMINGTDYHAGTLNPSPLDPSFQEYAVTGVTVANGATLQLWDQENNAGWAVNLDPASVATIVKDGDHYNCTAEGCYDFYIKLKMNQDQLYIGACSGGGDTPGGDTPGGTASYGIMINGTEYHEGTLNASPLDPSFQEYSVTGVSVANGATLQLWDKNNNAGWAVDLDPASVAGITRDGDHYNCTAEGCYDFYIKLKMNADQLYIGACTGGGDTPGGGGGTEQPDAYWYYKGYIDGGDLENEAGGFNIFNCGTAHLDVASDAYLFVMFQKKGVQGVQYMTTAYVDGPTHATMVTTGGEKMHVRAGSYTLYLYDNGDGSVELSTEQLSGKTLVKENCNTSTNIQL